MSPVAEGPRHEDAVGAGGEVDPPVGVVHVRRGVEQYDEELRQHPQALTTSSPWVSYTAPEVARLESAVADAQALRDRLAPRGLESQVDKSSTRMRFSQKGDGVRLEPRQLQRTLSRR